MRRRLVVLLIAVVVAAALAGPAAAHNPSPKLGKRLFKADDKVLAFQYSGSIPDWMAVDATKALLEDHQAEAFNNSKSPRFTNPADGSGNGTVRYRASLASPCSGSLIWLACSRGGGTTSWTINIRNLHDAPKYVSGHRSMWYDDTCSSGQLCFDLRHAFSHETMHIQNGSEHSTEDCRYTIFFAGARSKSSGNPCWNTHSYLPCDEASGQLNYGIRDLAGHYSTCLDHIIPGATGLRTTLSVTGQRIVGCQGAALTMSGRLEVGGVDGYRALAHSPLAARVIHFDVNGAVDAAAASANGTNIGDNWSATFQNAGFGARTYVAHFEPATGSLGSGLLASKDRPSFDVIWLPWLVC